MKVQKIAFFPKGVNLCFWPKNANFFLYLHLVKIRVEILLSHPWQRKNLFYYKKEKEFIKVQIIVFFSKGLIKKCQILFYLDLVKIRLEIMLSDFAELKKPVLTKKSALPKGLTQACFWSKNAIFFST